MPSLGGGGGGGGGAVVQTTSPWAASLAGQIGAQSAAQARELYSKSTADAIAAINNQYREASYAVSPYQKTGIQALDQYNQYLGLDPYNPGNTPTPPKAPTIEDFMKKVSMGDINSYVRDNSTGNGFAPGPGQPFVQLYSGVGYDQTPANPANPHGLTGMAYERSRQLGVGDKGSPIETAIRRELAQPALENAQTIYESTLPQYQQDLEAYNQNKAWYDRYSAEGPFTSSQLSDKITNLPGFQAQQDQGIRAINAAAGSKGYTGSGRILKELSNFGSNQLSNFYGKELDRLAGLINQGSQASQVVAGNRQNQGNAQASLYTSEGTNSANSALAAGNAISQGLIAGNQQFDTVGGGGSSGGLGGIGSLLGGVGSLIGGKGGATGLMALL